MDRNKSDLHNEIQNQVYLWMLDNGFKPVEQEVGIGKNWIADLAGVIQPTPTECQKLKFVVRKPNYNIKYKYEDGKITQRCRDLLEERGNKIKVWYEEVEKFSYKTLTAICEVKVSISDYKKDIERKFKQTPASINFLAYPKGMIGFGEVPDNWFGLEYISDKKIKMHPGKVVPKTKEEMFDIVFQLAMRIYNKNLYGRIAELQKERRIENIERANHYKISKVVSLFINILENEDNEDIETLLKLHGIKNISEHNQNRIKKLVENFHRQVPKEILK